MTNKSDDKSEKSLHEEGGGYGRPPMKRRFKTSGNKAGRPKGAKNKKTIVREIANETHKVSNGNQQVTWTTLKLVLIRLINMAMEGEDSRAAAELIKLQEKYEPSTASPQVGVLVAPAEISVEEWIARAEKQNALKSKPDSEP